MEVAVLDIMLHMTHLQVLEEEAVGTGGNSGYNTSAYVYSGGGGTQTAGGIAGYGNFYGTAGSFGQGGTSETNYNLAGGGGGGWYGGGRRWRTVLRK